MHASQELAKQISGIAQSISIPLIILVRMIEELFPFTQTRSALACTLESAFTAAREHDSSGLRNKCIHIEAFGS
jgi:hypothetical protein